MRVSSTGKKAANMYNKWRLFVLLQAPYLVITTEVPGNSSSNSISSGVGVPLAPDGISTVTPPESSTVRLA